MNSNEEKKDEQKKSTSSMGIFIPSQVQAVNKQPTSSGIFSPATTQPVTPSASSGIFSPATTQPVTPSASSGIFSPATTQPVTPSTSSGIFPSATPNINNLQPNAPSSFNNLTTSFGNTFNYDNTIKRDDISSLSHVKPVSIEDINKNIPFSLRQKSFEEIVEELKNKLENDIQEFKKKALEVYKLDDKLILLRNEYVKNAKSAEEELKLLLSLDENLEFYNNYVEVNDLVENNLINEIELLSDEVNNVVSRIEDENEEAKRLIDENMSLIRYIDNELSKLEN